MAAPVSAAARQTVVAAYGRLPLSFVANSGQLDSRVRFSAQQGNMSAFFTRGEALLSFAKGHRGAALGLSLAGASTASIVGEQRAAGRVSYLRGADRAKWHTGLATYGQVRYRQVWPGIDLVFHGGAGKLEYEFLVRPGANVRDIRLAYRGARGLTLDSKGDLVLATAVGRVVDSRPVSYQVIGGRRKPLATSYELAGGSAFRFALTGYDRRYPLVIDPGLVYSTYLGGSGGAADRGFGVAVDAAGNAYVTGGTCSATFPTTPGAIQPAPGAGGCAAFVSKFNSLGTGLVYSTYFGGDGAVTYGLAVDASGDAYITGATSANDFPTTPGAFQTAHASQVLGPKDAFVSKLNPLGTGLVYSTYLGGSADDIGYGIAVDATGDAYVTGQTNSADLPTTPGAFQTAAPGSYDAFVSKLNPQGTALDYSTYLGGRSSFDNGRGIAIDPAGDAYVTGQTCSSDFPTSVGAFQPAIVGGGCARSPEPDAFVSELNPPGAHLVYSTYLGGSGDDFGYGIAADAAGEAFVTGYTCSTDFPTSPAAFQAANARGGCENAFVSKLDPTGTALDYSTYLGGTGVGDVGYGVVADGAGNAYVTGQTCSSDFPVTAGAAQPAYAGDCDAFVSKLDPAGVSLTYSTFLGGNFVDQGAAIAIDSAGNAYVAGQACSPDFPVTPGAFQPALVGNCAVFVTKLGTPAAGGGGGAKPKIQVTSGVGFQGAVGSYNLGSVKSLNYKCRAQQSGLIGAVPLTAWLAGGATASCTAHQDAAGGPTVASGAAVDTSTVGQHTLYLTSTDIVGNTQTLQVVYNVVYPWQGFFAFANEDATHTLNLIQAWAQVKADFYIGGNLGLDVLVSQPTWTNVPCAPFAGWATVAVNPAAGAVLPASTLAFHPPGTIQGRYYYGQPATGNSGECYRFSLALNDGTTAHTSVFKLT